MKSKKKRERKMKSKKKRQRKMASTDYFSSIPDDIVSHILSKTSPRDVCRLSAVSSAFRRASQSDVVWETFVPSEFPEMVSNSIVSSPPFPSKKHLFFHLCNQFPVHLDDKTKILQLDKGSGKIHCTLGPGVNLNVECKDDRENYCFLEQYDASFPMRPVGQRWPLYIVRLGDAPVDIHGRLLDSPTLSPNKIYTASLVYFLSTKNATYSSELKVSIKIYNKAGQLISRQSRNCNDFCNGVNYSRERRREWMEIKIGEFYNGRKEKIGVVEMRLKEVQNWRRTRGFPMLIVYAINVRSID